MKNEYITVEMMADARERRAYLQKKLLFEYKKPLVCLTMNSAGPVKRSDLIDIAFFEAKRRLVEELPHINLYTIDEPTGLEAFFVADCDASLAKKTALFIEDMGDSGNGIPNIGRLFDIDVLDVSGEKLSRQNARKCLICEENAKECARSRRHSADELFCRSNEIIADWLSDELAKAAEHALIEEVEATPKPGLVDAEGSGAHDDMDIDTFRKSAKALRPYFKCMAEEAIAHKNKGELMMRLKSIGIEAEAAMFKATFGVNTHKGAIYTIGLLIAGITASALMGGSYESAFSFAKELALIGIEQKPFGSIGKSHGEQVRNLTGALGVRGHAASGFPLVVSALSTLDQKQRECFSKNDAIIFALLSTMTEIEDTNVLYRGGREMLLYMWEYSKKALEGDFMKNAERLNTEFIKRNISPGGAADIIAAAIFMDSCRHLMRQ